MAATTTSSPSTSTPTPDTPTGSSQSSQPGPTTTPGPKEPTGADASTYHYNSATGMWENDYYIWNPTTGQTQPKTPQTYSYNPATGRWDTTQWVYDPASGTYRPNTVSVAQPPAGAPTVGSAAVAGPSTAVAATVTPGTNSASGSSSVNSATNNSQPSGTFDLFYNASISNAVNATAASGDANVVNNTLGGNAASGDATVIATIANLLQSSANIVDPNNAVIFTSDIQGNVTGDLLIDPSALAKQLSSSSTSTQPNNLTVNATGSGQINNAVDLAAASGSAAVTGNTTGGSATSGNANAVANIVNILNSAISSGQSFIGTVNIYGNLDGDILLPPGMLSALLASNAPATTPTPVSSTTSVSTANNQAINNQISTATSTGSATVSNNTTAGNATSGNALSNITILNLTGSNVIGSNDMLVFVNVLGKWVGAIVNAPTGVTAAELGSGITSNTSTPLAGNTNITSATNGQINNNISLAATSGSAAVTGNTTGGNATSGNATTSANLLNITSSNLSLSSWFGILFINVFGTWYGSFGVNTSAGDPVAQPASTSNTSTPNSSEPAQVFQFIPTRNTAQPKSNFTLASLLSTETATPSTDQSAPSSSNNPSHFSAVLGSHTTTPPTTSTQPFSVNYWIPIVGLVIGASLFITERALSRREQEQSPSS